MKTYNLNIYGRIYVSRQITKCYRYILFDKFKKMKQTNSKHEMKIYMDMLGLKLNHVFRKYKYTDSTLIYQLEYVQGS